MPVKVFTLEEANRLLPRVRELLLETQEAVQGIIRIQDAISVIRILGGEDPKSPEHEGFKTKTDELEAAAAVYENRLDELQKLGCVLKDLNHGIVDFYGSKEGRLIFLCWRLGEPAIGFWHELDAGMAGRRPVIEL
jgi:hypothetical protein